MAKHTPCTTCANCGAADGGRKTFDKEKNKAFVAGLYNRYYGRKH